MIYFLNREIRQPSSAIILQTEKNSMIQQFREAPSAYIFFVHELIQNFIEMRNAAKILKKIFQKFKNHFWGGLDEDHFKQRMNIDIENEHMALFFYNIMKDNAIYKIMKCAQQTLEDDKTTLQEYKIFIKNIEMYKWIYSHCKQCYNSAFIKQKYENNNKMQNAAKRAPGMPCADKNCKVHHPEAPCTSATPEETQTVEANSGKFAVL